jgi:hypothetical protein
MKTTRTQRREPPDSSVPNPAPKTPSKRRRTSEAPKPTGGPFVRTDITPEELFSTFGRKRIEIWIEKMIELVDASDGDCDLEPEPVEPNYAGFTNVLECQDEAESDQGCDDREGDELQHGGDEHDGAEPDVDGEPSLGWGLNGETGNVFCDDREMSAPSTDKKAWSRYRHRGHGPNDDGMHVDVDRGLRIGPRRIRNLSETQERVLAPRIDHREVRI